MYLIAIENAVYYVAKAKLGICVLNVMFTAISQVKPMIIVGISSITTENFNFDQQCLTAYKF